MHLPFGSFLISELGWSCALSMAVAQGIKPFVALVRGQPFHLGRMFSTGGMPSSHTSLVTTLTFGVAAVEGADSAVFTMVLIFSLYFVLEATGLRQEVGEQAKLLNEMLDELTKTHHIDRTRLRELVGHTWQEVLGGGILGFLVYWITKDWVVSGAA